MSKWLRCIISKGMFSDECTVVVSTRSGEKIAVFVPKHYAKEQENLVQVMVSEEGEHAIAMLPDANQSEVEVNAAELLPA